MASANKVVAVMPEDTTYLNERVEALAKLAEMKTRGKMMQSIYDEFRQATVEVASSASASDTNFRTIVAPPSRANSISVNN